MKVLIVSDTHGRDEKLEEVVRLEKPFDILIHCGDVEGREFFIEALAECRCYIVSGNNDFFSNLPREYELVIGGKRTMITHGHYYGVSMGDHGILDEARERNFQVVMYGHTHRPIVTEKDGVMIINPGSLSYPRQEGRQPSYAVLDTGKENNRFDVEIKYLSR